ncbi:MAG: restriction endonuclease subunit S [Syntrophomonadaceae bacterium]|jgi:type I restriction enzyme S subunit|nr:restriction endonuclease subunit S [Syntrophomonadaceae bacterium]
MKKGWEEKKISEVFSTKPPKKEARERLKEDDLVSFVPMEDLGVLTKHFISPKVRTIKEVSGSYTYFAENDVLLAKITPCFENGKIGIARNLTNGIGFGSSEYFVFRSTEAIIPDYLYYFLSREQFRKNGAKLMTGAVGHKRVARNFVENSKIPYPIDLSEQMRIVTILDESFAAIDKAKENAQKNLNNARELFDSYLQSVFDNAYDKWEEYKMGEIYDVRDGTHDSPKYHKEGYALITSKNLKDESLDYSEINYISEQDYNKINERSKVDIGDILYAMIGTIGKPVVIEKEPDFAIKNVALFKVPSEQNSYFLKYYLNSQNVINRMKNDAKGTTQKFIGLGYLRSFPIFVPTRNEQDNIVKKLDALSAETKKLEAIYEQKLADLEELKQSILEKAFKGEL